MRTNKIKERMKKFLVMCCAALALTACEVTAQQAKNEHQPKVSKNMQVEPFERICLEGSPTLYYSQAAKVSVRVEAPADLMEHIDVKVKDARLTIKVRDSVKDVLKRMRLLELDGDLVKIYVSSPDLIEATVIGSGDIKCKNLLDTDNLQLEVKGAGDIDFDDIICDNISCTVVGSGDIDIEHVVAQTSAIEIIGSGDVEMKHDGVRQTNITVKGSGDVKAGFNRCGNVTCDLRGSGDIELIGDVQTLQHSQLGSGQYKLGGLSIKQKK